MVARETSIFLCSSWSRGCGFESHLEWFNISFLHSLHTARVCSFTFLGQSCIDPSFLERIWCGVKWFSTQEGHVTPLTNDTSSNVVGSCPEVDRHIQLRSSSAKSLFLQSTVLTLRPADNVNLKSKFDGIHSSSLSYSPFSFFTLVHLCQDSV